MKTIFAETRRAMAPDVPCDLTSTHRVCDQGHVRQVSCSIKPARSSAHVS